MPQLNVTQKKLIKEAEKAQKKVERERERLIKQQQKDEENKRKQEEKERILSEKKLKKEQEERDKEEKRKQKEEEKKLRELKKEEEEQKKEEIRKKKEEEKLQQEEEKRKEEEEKERVRNKQKALFTSFFIKKDVPEEKTKKVPPSSVKVSKLFMQFELKKDMMISPVSRVSEEERKAKAANLDSLDNCDNQSNYLSDLKSSHYKNKVGRSSATWPLQTPDLQIIIPRSSTSTSSQYSKRMKTKFFQFVENYRPAYFGTWRKSSKVVNSRRPFAQDNLFFDYEVDSDDEWEEEEPGENISHSEEENEEEEDEAVDDDEDNDGFFVPHGYLSDDEGAEAGDEDMTPEIRKIRQQLEEKQYELSQKKKIQPLRSVINGLRWLNDEEDDGDVLRQYKIHAWTQLPVQCSVEDVELTATPLTKSPKRREIPEEALVYLAQILNKNALSFSKLAYEFRMFWEKMKTGVLPELSYDEDKKGQSWGLFQISKSQLKNQVKKMASHDGYCWNLLPEIAEKYSSSNLSEPWSYVTDINQKQSKPSSAKKKEKNKKKDQSISDTCDVVISPCNFLKQFAEPTTPSKPAPLSTSNVISHETENKPQKRLYITNFFTSVNSPPTKKSKAVEQCNGSNCAKKPNDIGEPEVIVIDS